MNNLNHTVSEPIVQSTDGRMPYAAPQLVTFGAIRDLTAGGSMGVSENGMPGKGMGGFGHHS